MLVVGAFPGDSAWLVAAPSLPRGVDTSRVSEHGFGNQLLVGVVTDGRQVLVSPETPPQRRLSVHRSSPKSIPTQTGRPCHVRPQRSCRRDIPGFCLFEFASRRAPHLDERLLPGAAAVARRRDPESSGHAKATSATLAIPNSQGTGRAKPTQKTASTGSSPRFSTAPALRTCHSRQAGTTQPAPSRNTPEGGRSDGRQRTRRTRNRRTGRTGPTATEVSPARQERSRPAQPGTPNMAA